MKPIGILLIVLGIAMAIGSVWLSHIELRNTFRNEIAQIGSSANTPNTSISATSAITQARSQLIQSRRELDRTLSELRSVKTAMVGFSRLIQPRPGEDTSRAQAAVRNAQGNLEELQRRVEAMNATALRAESETRDVIMQYENALNIAAEEALKKSSPKTNVTTLALPIIGALVSVTGLVLSWRSKEVEKQKTLLEIAELRQKLEATESTG
ncbi:MAG: hypothetical protein MRK01_02850 [Candidatus Scalindua sp.]|nr:hypothetical protein [Candidatus Scalindua sp.]